MISQLIPVKKENLSGVLIASLLFVLQFAYFQMQDVILQPLAGQLSFLNGSQIAGITINQAVNVLRLVPLGMHALFSVVIVWFLYKDWSGTKVVINISILLILLYLITNVLGKFIDEPYIGITSTNLHLFLASPFKTILSIPMLKIKHQDDDEK